MQRYALRYVPLLILALLLIPLRIFIDASEQQSAANAHNNSLPLSEASSQFKPGTVLYSVAALSSGDAWVVGGSFIVKVGMLLPVNSIILHCTDSACMAVNSELKVPLLSVALDSPSDGWAVGWSSAFVHYDGHTWSSVAGPRNFKQNLLGVVMLSPSDGWAVGYSGSILHYDGRKWALVESPTHVDLHGISMPSDHDGWAVGDNGTILHYSAGAWSLVHGIPTSSVLTGITMLSAHEGWAVGRQGTILHYRDGTWEIVHPAAYYQNANAYQSIDFFNVAMNTIHSGWIIGDQHILRYKDEAWIEMNGAINTALTTQFSAPIIDGFRLNAGASSSDEDWLVGSVNDIKKDQNTFLILHYQGGRWDAVGIPGG